MVIPHFESQSLSSSLTGFLYNQVTSCVSSNKMKKKIIEKIIKFESDLAAYLIKKKKLVRMGGQKRRGGIISLKEKIFTRVDSKNGSNHLGFDGVTINIIIYSDNSNDSNDTLGNSSDDDEYDSDRGIDSDNHSDSQRDKDSYENKSNSSSRRSSKINSRRSSNASRK
jgi:hypothetical protein